LFIWGASYSETRSTFPRKTAPAAIAGNTAGYKRVKYSVTVSILSAVGWDNTNLNDTFPALLDAVQKALRSIPIAVVLVDPATEETSQLLLVGEDMTVNYGDPVTLQDQRLPLYHGKVRVTVEEWVQS